MLSRRTSFVSILYKAEEEPTVTIRQLTRGEELHSENVVLLAHVESPLRGLNNITATWQRHVRDAADPDAGDWADVTSSLNVGNGRLTHTIAKLNTENFNSKFRVRVALSTYLGTDYPEYEGTQYVTFEILDERIKIPN